MSLEQIEERLVFFPGGGTSLAGILAVPAEPNGCTVLIPWGAGPFPSSGRNQVRTRLARTLAGQGFHSFRFDYQGVGESGGDYRRPNMARPNTEEIVAASTWLTSQGFTRIVVIANCFGAWSSLMAAPLIPGLEGMALVNTPVRRSKREAKSSWRWWLIRLKRLTLRKLRSAERRAIYRKMIAGRAASLLRVRSGSTASLSVRSGSSDTRFSSALGYLLDRHTPVLLMYGDDPFRPDVESELGRGLRSAIERASAPTRLITLPDRLGEASLRAQHLLLKEAVSWLHELPEPPP